ncbi:MAG: M20/M25/M40 family metallo-hydrolase [Holophagales bacterium]|jgi:hypothetical protein|nr:M20/M25/M40 family metallo-hydrolase [Holophagales bacterium]
MRLNFAIAAALLFAFASVYAKSQIISGESAISGRNALATVARLADKSCAGRLSGHYGYTNAARWTMGRFMEIGLNGTLQPYSSPYSIVDGGRLEVTLHEEKLTAKMLTDFMPLLFSDSGHIKARAVFVGWGIRAPEHGYDDYANIDVSDKFVLCFRGAPDDDQKWVQHDEHRTRMSVALEKGAVGLIYVYPRVIAHPNGDLQSAFLTAMISDSFFDKLLTVEGTTSESLQRQLLRTGRPASLSLDAVIDLTVKARHFPKGEGYNVVACLYGADPGFKHECVVIGAHLDGVGDHAGFRFPGAEDNASGCAVVMEIAKAFMANSIRPKRSVVFVLFGSEEQGGRGSAHFIDRLPPGLARISAFINFDMVGIGGKANIGINEFMEIHRNILEQSDQKRSVISNVRLIKSLGVRSGDIAPFFKKNIPLATVSSNGLRPKNQYHQPGDLPGLAQPMIMESISKLMFRFAFELCEVNPI